jgi:hypothetical protein
MRRGDVKLEHQTDGTWLASERINDRPMICEGRTQDEAWYGLISFMSDRFNDRAEAMMHDLPALLREQAV